MSEIKDRNLLIRVDAGKDIGYGHAMRCLALAQAWQDEKGNVTFVMAKETPSFTNRLHKEKIETIRLRAEPGSNEDAAKTAEIAKEINALWVVVDGYHFDATFQQKLKDASLRLLFIDDYGHAKYYAADIILNQNIHAAEEFYPNRAPYTRLLLGTNYVLLRREFLRWQGYKRDMPDVARKVLITMGGGDQENVTLKVLQALNEVEIEGLEAVAVVGGSNPHYETLKNFTQTSRLPIRLEKDAQNMPELMAWADAAISAGGTTTYELAFMGVPFIVIVLAENQRPIAEGLHKNGIAINVGWHFNLTSPKLTESLSNLCLDQKHRTQMSKQSRAMINGNGVIKVLSCLNSEIISLRPANKNDCQLLWEWTNDSEVRRSSFNMAYISWEEHINWFNNKLNDPNCIIFIAEDSTGTPIGQIRFDIIGEEAEISISVDNSFRGLGYGVVMIRKGAEEIFQKNIAKIIHALVKLDNIASAKSFDKAGFKDLGTNIVKNYKAKHYVIVKDNQ